MIRSLHYKIGRSPGAWPRLIWIGFTDSRAFKFCPFCPVTIFVDPLKFDLDLPESEPVNARARECGRGLSNQDRIQLYRERFNELAREQGFREAVDWLLRVAARRD